MRSGLGRPLGSARSSAERLSEADDEDLPLGVQVDVFQDAYPDGGDPAGGRDEGAADARRSGAANTYNAWPRTTRHG